MKRTGTVVAAFGRHVLVRDPEGSEWRARPYGRRLSVVCGDAVQCEFDARHGETYVVSVLPRRTSLYRANSSGRPELLAANLSLLLVTLAPVPEPDFHLVDRYLSAAACASLDAVLVVNKCDLGLASGLRAELDAFARIGYRSIECSARAGLGAESLVAACEDSVAALVGQSGVGKSSLVLHLVPRAEIETGELVRNEHGRHTTTAWHLYDLPRRGRLIDSPGTRDFVPALEPLEAGSLGFIEIARLGVSCRFGDCRHLTEPGCAVRAAAESGALHPRRYESYKRLRRLRDGSLAAGRGW